jgi:cell division protein FtsB
MRILAAVLAGLIVLLQFPLWLGKGGWLRVWDLDRQVQGQKDQNAKVQKRNSALDAEVRDLKQGFDAVEERARYELGMVKQDEVFFQIVEPQQAAGPKPALKSTPSTEQTREAAKKQ